MDTHLPAEIKYTTSHEWLRLEESGLFTVGITYYAQELLGDLVFIELPELGEVSAGATAGTLESVKAASDIYCPLSGKIIEVNSVLANKPELANTDPYGAGWLFRMQSYARSEIEKLLDVKIYAAMIAANK